MLTRKFGFFSKRFPTFRRSAKSVDEGKSKSWGHKAVSFVLITVTGGVALSALDDLSIYYGCSRVKDRFKFENMRLQVDGFVERLRENGEFTIFTALLVLCLLAIVNLISQIRKCGTKGDLGKAIDKASKNQALKDAIGEPIVRGPWYNASLAVAHKRQSVSCTFPVSGPQGTGIFQLKAVRNGDDSWFSYFRPHDWEILIMEALLHVPGNDEKQKTFRMSLSDNSSPAACSACAEFSPQESENTEKK